MAERFRCAVSSLALGEPCHATASQARRWMLVEQPGPWGVDAVGESALPTRVALRLKALARAAGARLVLVRRHGRTPPGERSAFAVVSTGDLRRVERLAFDDPTELLDVDWPALRTLAPVGGAVVDVPLYLVCTNGKHDACCAEFGRPVAKVLAAALGDAVWEVSHIGGDRFAANVVCLPDGVYYGRMTPDEALRVLRDHAAGTLDLTRYRGRSYLDFPVQAAEQLAREALGLTGVDDLRARGVDHLEGGLVRVAFDAADEPVTVEVACADAVDPQQLTCRSRGAEHPPRYRLLAITRPPR